MSGNRGVMLLALLAGCTPGQLEMAHEPRFTSFSRNYPPTRPMYPPGDWSTPAPEMVSGFDYMLTFRPEETEPGGVVIQRVAVTGLRRDTTNECADTEIPIGFTFLEYFRAPSHDLQAWLEQRPERTYFEARRSIVAYGVLPGQPPPIAPGRQSAFLDDAYLNTLTDDDRARFQPGQLDDASFVRWEHQYEYDGCNGRATAETGCGITHCLHFVWHVVENGRAGRDRVENFSGPGGSW